MSSEKIRILRKYLKYTLQITSVLTFFGIIGLFFYYAPIFYERNMVLADIGLYGQAGMYPPNELYSQLIELENVLSIYYVQTRVLVIVFGCELVCLVLVVYQRKKFVKPTFDIKKQLDNTQEKN